MKKKSKRIPDETREEIYSDIVRGKSYSQIGKKYNVSKGSIAKIKEEHRAYISSSPKKNKQTRVSLKQKREAAIIGNEIKKSNIIIGNFLKVGEAIVKGAEKLDDIAENSESRVEDLTSGLKKLNQTIKEKTATSEYFGNKNQRQNLIKDIYKVLEKISDYYSSNKLIIESVRELRKHAEAYSKLKAEADSLSEWTNFIDAVFAGCELLSDKEYIKLRDHVIKKSEMGKRLFAKYDPMIANL